MSDKTLKMIFNKVNADPSPLIVTISRWNSIPISNPDEMQPLARFSKSGNFLVNGISFGLPFVHNVSAWVTEAEARTLLAIWEISQNRRKTSSNWQIVIEDLTEIFFEERTASTKTRSNVPETEVTEANGGVYYFPKFQAYMPKKPVFGDITNSGDRTAIFILQETGVKI